MYTKKWAGNQTRAQYTLKTAPQRFGSWTFPTGGKGAEGIKATGGTCSQCRNFQPAGMAMPSQQAQCNLFKGLNKRLSDIFDVDPYVNPNGHCNAWVGK